MGETNEKKYQLLAVMVLTTFFFFVELVVGYMTNSMALVADSFHMLGDILALTISLISIRMLKKKTTKNTFGWARAEVLGALVNAVFLVALSLSLVIEAIKRFIQIEPINEPELLLIVGVIGLIINIIGLFVLREHSAHGHSQEVIRAELRLTSDGEPTVTRVARHSPGDMNMHAAFLHVLSDALGSVIVVASACIVWLTDWKYRYYVDPALSLILVALMMQSVWPLLRDSALILLQTVPMHIEVEDLQKRLLEDVDGIIAIHEFHVWQLAGDRIIASAHIKCRDIDEYMTIAEKVKQFFHNEGIHSTTIQPEFVEFDQTMDSSCVLDCPLPGSGEGCSMATCCQRKNSSPESSLQSLDDFKSLRQRYIMTKADKTIDSDICLSKTSSVPNVSAKKSEEKVEKKEVKIVV